MLQAPPILGRDAEIDAIARLLDERGGALILRGEPGIGKSTLLKAASRRAADRGMRVLATAGVQSETHLAFAGLHQLLRPVLDHAEALPAPQRDAVLAAFGMSDEHAPDLFLIALAALELLGDAADRSPVLLAVEDAHWLDHATADVLAFVARRLESAQIALIAALRDGSDSPLAGAGLPELRLDALDPATSAALLDQHAPELEPAVRERLIAEAAGNPLALVELPVPWQRTDPDATVPDWLPLTARLERAFAARGDELPAATRTLLLLAAVDDGGVLAEVLDAAARLPGLDGVDLEAFDPAVSAGLVTIEGRHVQFRHPLVRSAIHQAAGAAQRQAAHAALAEALAGQPDRRVWHRAAAALGADEEVTADLEAVARRAQRRGGIAAAVDALERAAELSLAPVRRAGRLLRAAELGFELGRRDLVQRLLRDAEALELGPLERARIAWIRGMTETGPLSDAARSSLIDAADRARAEGDSDLALSLLWLVAQRCWWTDAGNAAGGAVIAAADRVDDVDDLRLLAISAYAAPLERGAQVLQRLEHAPETGDAGATRLLGSAAVVLGAFDHAAVQLAASAADLRSQGRLGHLPRVLTLRGWAATFLADWSVALPAAEEVERLAAETRQPVWAAGGQLLRAMVAAIRGDHEAADAYAAAAEQASLPTGAAFMLAGIQLARGLSALGAGRYDDAQAELLRVFDPADPAYHSFMCTWAIGDLAEAALHSGDPDRARELLDEVVAAHTPSPWVQAAIRYARALLATGPETEAHFQDALVGDMTRWPLLRARVLLAYGAWLRRERRVAESRAPLRAARDAFDALGANPWGERARQELRASGETSRRRTAEARDELTPQELQIAQLAAEGLSNREIGQTLYLSHRTVGSHLYRIFPKLGISSRSELGAALTT